MYLCAYTLNHGPKDAGALPDIYFEDVFQIFETRAEAGRFVEQELLTLDKLHCWAVAEITAASEPHWLEDVA
jgi:hypothetical protein